MPAGRPAHTLCGITAAQWSAAIGDTSRPAYQRASRAIAGRRGVPAEEVAAVADGTGVPLDDLCRALAALRGYLAADAPAGDPSDPAPS